MYASGNGAERARWQVIWRGDNGKFVRQDFEADLASALELYGKALKVGKDLLTLRCCNAGFAPPAKYHDTGYEIVVASNGKRYKKKVTLDPPEYKVIMGGLNARGIWWCPYCLQMRRFVRRHFYKLDGIRVNEPSMNCPVCNVSHRDGNVSKYNPIAARYVELKRERSDKGVGR